MFKNKTTEKEVVITEQQKQNDPVIRTTFKKCRNITKKITDIEQLEGRPDLKPEQVEKVRGKTALVEERKKFEEFAKFYKTIISENAVENRGQINPDFTKISQLVVLSQFLSLNPNSDAASAFSEPELKLVDSVNGKPTETLGERSLRLSQSIKAYMENAALVSKVEQLNNDAKFSGYTLQKNSTIATFQPIQTKEVKKETVVVAPVKQEPVVAPVAVVAPAPVETPKPKIEEKVVTAPAVVAQPPKEQKPVEIPAPVVETEKKVEVPAPVVSTPAPVVETPKQPEVKAVAETKVEATTVTTTVVKEEVQGEKQPFNKSENRGDRPERPYKKQYRERGEGENRGEHRAEYRGEYRAGGNRGGERGGYRGPRDNNRRDNRENPRDNKSDTSLESSGEKEITRQFNQKQVKELVDDGFHIVGKKDTRQKPKNPREAQEYHRRQHGYREKQDR